MARKTLHEHRPKIVTIRITEADHAALIAAASGDGGLKKKDIGRAVREGIGIVLATCNSQLGTSVELFAPAGPPRNKLLHVYFTKEEYAALKSAAEGKRDRIADFVRQAVKTIIARKS